MDVIAVRRVDREREDHRVVEGSRSHRASGREAGSGAAGRDCAPDPGPCPGSPWAKASAAPPRVEEHRGEAGLLAVVLDAEDADAVRRDLPAGDQRREAQDEVLTVGLDVGTVAALDGSDEDVGEAQLERGWRCASGW